MSLRWTDRLLARLGPPLAAGFIRLLGATLRLRVVDQSGLLGGGPPPPAIAVFWHNRLLMLPWAFAHAKVPIRFSAMISRSKDGSLIADTAAKFGVTALRGSSSKGAAGASRAALDALAAGGWVGITPDGPRGPVYTVKPGLAGLAQKSGVPVVPFRVTYGWKIRARSWDRFQVPLPFSRMEVVIGKPVACDPDGMEEQIRAALGE